MSGNGAGDWSLDEAKVWLRAQVEAGAHCPCCNQYAKVYRRKLNRSMVGVLAALTQAGGRSRYVHAAEECRARRVRQQGDAGKLGLFGLTLEEPERREDGGRSGWWMVTARGEDFLKGRLSLPKYARVYDDRVLGFTGDLVSVHDVAPGFRFDDLMRGT